MFISDLARTTTIFGNGLSKGRLWIKACYMKTKGSPKELTPITLKQQMLLGDRLLALALPAYQNVST